MLLHREFDIHESDIETLLTPLSKFDTKKSSSKETYDEIDDVEPKFLDMYSSIYSMREDLEKLRKPSGSRANPVRNCKDLYLGHPNYKDGKYHLRGKTLNCTFYFLNETFQHRMVLD